MACKATNGGFKCGKGTVTIGATDPSITQHAWTVDGVPESTAAQFQKTYNTVGTHSIIHAGTNSCGGVCSQNTQLEIVAPKGVSLLAIGAVLTTLGILGIVMLKK